MNNTLYHLWKSDLYRYEGKTGIKIFLKHFFLSPGYKYSFFMRLCNKLASTKYMYPAWILSILFLMHYETKYGISIPFKTNIGKGFYIGHFGTIIVSSKSTIGNNCNISQGVTKFEEKIKVILRLGMKYILVQELKLLVKYLLEIMCL